MRPDPTDWQDATVFDSHGSKIGKVRGLFVDKETQQPEWLIVDTGVMGPEVLVPITGLEEVGGGVQLPFTEEQVTNAPHVNPSNSLTMDQERDLYSYYGIPYSTDESSTVLPRDTARSSTGRDQDMESRDESLRDERVPTPPPAMGVDQERDLEGARGSSEQSGDTRPGEGGSGIRVRKRIVTEYVSVDVPVEREEVVIENEAGERIDERQVGLDEEEPGKRAA